MRRIVPMLIVSVLLGCSRPPADNEIPGVYVVEYKGDRQVITVLADQTYTNTLYRAEKLIWTYRNKWAFDKTGNDERLLTFEQFRFGVRYEHDIYGKSGPGFWPALPEKDIWGHIKLPFDPDLSDRSFVKKEP